MPRRVAALAGIHLVAFAIAASRMSAQPSRIAFDYRSELRPGHESTVIARGDFNGDGIPDIVVAGPGRITVFEQGATSFDWRAARTTIASAVPIAAITGRLNGDSRDDLVLLCGPRPTVAEIYITDSRGIPVLSSTIELPGEFRQALVADPDADRDTDLLFFGKKTLGVAVYTGNGKGSFIEGPLLMPELSVSLAAVAPMDGDNVPDVVVADWLGNTVQVHPGFGALHFGDPAVVSFEDEPVSLAVGDLNGDRIRDFVAGFADRPGYAVFTGDGLGGFAASPREEAESAPEKIRIGDIDGDARNDILLFLPAANSVAIRFQGADGGFSSRQTYSTGAAPSDVVFFQDSRRRMLNGSVLSTGNDVVRLLHNASANVPDQGAWTLATGAGPGDLEIADLNGDGWADVILGRDPESGISLFLNDGRGVLGGQMNIAIPEPATTLRAVASPPGESDFLTTGPDGASISYLSLDAASLSVTAMSLRAEGGIIALDGRRNAGAAGRRVYTMRESNGRTEATIFSYDLPDPARYGETEIPLDIPGRIAAISGCDLDGDRKGDLAVLSVPDTGNAASVSLFRQTDDGFEPDRVASIVLSVGAASPGPGLWMADLDGDGAEDLILNFRKPANTLAVSIAAGGSAFGAPSIVQSDVRIPGRRSLLVVDFDGDGRRDLVFVNERTRTVQFLPGDGSGGFEGPVNLTSARGVRGFGTGDLNGDSEMELVLSNADEGTLTVTSFHHPLFVRRKGRGGE